MTRLRHRAVSLFAIALFAPVVCMAAPCSDEDFRTRVTGADECVVLAAYGVGAQDAGASGATPRTLVVWLHGDTSGGGPATSHVQPAAAAAARFSSEQVLSIALWRPGYGDAEGHVSGGDAHGRTDHYTLANMNIVGDAIDRLKHHHGVTRTIVVGHSGGAATAANLMGIRPGLADAAVLISCPCDLRAWRAGRRWWPRSEDPAAWVSKVAPSATVVALTGAADDNTAPSLAHEYVAKLVARRVDARFVAIPGAGHNAALTAPEVMTELAGLLR